MRPLTTLGARMSSTTTAHAAVEPRGGSWPDLTETSWPETLATLHRFTQLVGKIRLAAAPRRNHWWNVAFSLTGRGMTTRPMGADPIFTIDFDLLDHRLEATTVDGLSFSFPLHGKSVAAFTAELRHGLRSIGRAPGRSTPIPTTCRTRRAPSPRTRSTRELRPRPGHPLVADDEPGEPDPRGVRCGLGGQDQPGPPLLARLRLAVTRFSDRHVDPGARPIPSTARRTPARSSASASGSATTIPRAGLLLLHRAGAGRADRRAARARGARWTERPGKSSRGPQLRRCPPTTRSSRSGARVLRGRLPRRRVPRRLGRGPGRVAPRGDRSVRPAGIPQGLRTGSLMRGHAGPAH